jgi:D-beta-D-heptose 7-phosphate kinase/D-beta-D-heptose 1-phosphate adenosyltransferase
VLITRGEHGMSLFQRAARALHVPTAAREVFDVTGAGDTVIATLALALPAGARLAEAAMLANCAAGVVVGKIGTAVATPPEVLAAVGRAG